MTVTMKLLCSMAIRYLGIAEPEELTLMKAKLDFVELSHWNKHSRIQTLGSKNITI
jgi:hypothetical protein